MKQLSKSSTETWNIIQGVSTCCCCLSTPDDDAPPPPGTHHLLSFAPLPTSPPLIWSPLLCLVSSLVASTAVSGAEDVALYVGMVAVALCLTLLLIVVVLVYRRKKEGLDADVADSSILTTGFQPMGIKPSKPGVWAPRPRRPPLRSSRTLFFVSNLLFFEPVRPSVRLSARRRSVPPRSVFVFVVVAAV